MRLAFVSIMAGSPWGASEALWAQTALRALHEGHAVFVSVYRCDETPAAIAELERAGAHIDLRPRDRWSRRFALVSRLRGVYRTLERFAPDVICLSQGGTYDISRGGGISELRSVLKRIRAPYALLCHCEQAAPSQRRLRRAREAFSQAAVVGVLAANLREMSERHLGISLPQARIFQNPVNLKNADLLPWPGDEPLRLAFVGRLEPIKNPSLLIQVLSSSTWLQRHWTLTVCGTGPERNFIEQQSGLWDRISGRIRFAGYVHDIAALWAKHHVLVMPSQLEGLPLAMIEAMLCGRPVVATNIGGISDWLQDAENGFLIEKPTAMALDSALERMWTNRARLQAMGTRAHQLTKAKRDPDPAGTLQHWLEEAARSVYAASADPTTAAGRSSARKPSDCSR